MKAIMVFLGLCAAVHAFAQIQAVAGSLVNGIGSAMVGAQNITAETRKFVVRKAQSDGSMVDGDVFLMREPNTGLIWWAYQSIGAGGPEPLDRLGSQFHVSFSPSEVVGFVYDTPFLSILPQPAAKYNSLDAAQAAVLAQLSRITEPMQSFAVRQFKRVNVARDLPLTFRTQFGHQQQSSIPRIKGINRVDGEWRLTLTGADQRDVVIALDSSYRTTRINGAQVK